MNIFFLIAELILCELMPDWSKTMLCNLLNQSRILLKIIVFIVKDWTDGYIEVSYWLFKWISRVIDQSEMLFDRKAEG